MSSRRERSEVRGINVCPKILSFRPQPERMRRQVEEPAACRRRHDPRNVSQAPPAPWKTRGICPQARTAPWKTEEFIPSPDSTVEERRFSAASASNSTGALAPGPTLRRGGILTSPEGAKENPVHQLYKLPLAQFQTACYKNETESICVASRAILSQLSSPLGI